MYYRPFFSERFFENLNRFPDKEIPRILEKVRFLTQSPHVDGDTKKKIKGAKDAYRVESGHYRAIYSFGTGWVSLLDVGHRKDIYRNSNLSRLINDDVDPDDVPESLEISEMKGPSRTSSDGYQTQVAQFEGSDPNNDSSATGGVNNHQQGSALLHEITDELLKRMHIDEKWFPSLTACRTDVDLENADVPEDIYTRVYCVASSDIDYEAVMAAPQLVVNDVEDIVRAYDGDLIGALLRLDEDQLRLAMRIGDGKGPLLIKGAPGTGKTTIMVHGACLLLQTLINEGLPEPRILFTGFNNSLVDSARKLFERELGVGQELIEIRTADSLARRFATTYRNVPKISNDELLNDYLDDAVVQVRSVMDQAQQVQLDRLMLRLRTHPPYLRDRSKR